jgi:hypothetical protein
LITATEIPHPILAEVLTWPAHLSKAWRHRVGELTRPDSSGEDLLTAEIRAYAEMSPSGTPWRAIVSSWPVDRRERFVVLALELAEAGIPSPEDERRTFLLIGAEDDLVLTLSW